MENEYWGRIEILLYPDGPKTAENFRCLCTGEKGKGQQGHALHYKGCHFHTIVPYGICQAGDIITGDGFGGESIYGPYFDDENFNHKHDKPYLIAMGNQAEANTNSSQFYLTSKPCDFLDNYHVVFGEVTNKKG